MNRMGKIWRIPVTYTLTGYVEIKKDTLEESIDEALVNFNLSNLTDNPYKVKIQVDYPAAPDFNKDCKNARGEYPDETRMD